MIIVLKSCTVQNCSSKFQSPILVIEAQFGHPLLNPILSIGNTDNNDYISARSWGRGEKQKMQDLGWVVEILVERFDFNCNFQPARLALIYSAPTEYSLGPLRGTDKTSLWNDKIVSNFPLSHPLPAPIQATLIASFWYNQATLPIFVSRANYRC